MLVLSRKSGEEIFIGSGIKVTVLGINGGRVSLGLCAPSEIPIHRSELRRYTDEGQKERPVDDSSGLAEHTNAPGRGSV